MYRQNEPFSVVQQGGFVFLPLSLRSPPLLPHSVPYIYFMFTVLC